MDLMGPLPMTAQGNKPVLVVAKAFTKWVEAFPVPNMEAETVAKVVAHEIICHFGTPRPLHSDQGRTFQGRVLKELARTLGMDKTQTTPYHPQTDGQVERFNRTLAAILTAVVAPDQSDWDEHLPFLTAAYRATPRPATGHSPNFMMFGQEAILPVDIMYGVLPEEEEKPSERHPQEVRRKLWMAFGDAYASLKLGW